MENLSKICIGCLSSDRKLSPIRREERNDLFNSCLSSKVNISEPLHMCWECIAIIRKAIRFKVRVQKSIAFLDQLNTSKNISSLSTLTHRSIPQDDTILYTYEEKPRDLKHSRKEHIIRAKIEFTGAGYTETNKTDSKKLTVPSTTHILDDDSIALSYDSKSTEVLADSRDGHVKGEIEFTDTGLPEPVKLEPKLEFISEDNLNEVDVSVDNSDAGEDFNVSDDEPLVFVKVQKEKEVRSKSRKKTRFNITNKPSGVINNVSVQKQLKKWNITDDRVEMLLLSWDEVKEERQRALQALSVAQNAYKCDDCVLGFNHRFKFDNHMKKHDQSAGECICSICSIRCRHERALSQHLRRHRVRWRCRECFASYSRAEVLADHVTTSHQLPASRQCHLCDYTASTLSKLRSHMRVHREPKRCQVCARTFTSTTSLHTHMMIHKGEKEFSCPKCEKQFLFKSAMETHLMTHDNSIKLYCHECDVTFKNRNSYAQHMKYNSKHIDPARLKFECESCGKKFAQAHRLNEHKMAVHLKLTPIACPTPNCTFTCSSRSVLRSHMGVVHRNTRSIRNHVCHVCGKAYITKRNLESHIRAHTGERPFVCSICPASFAHDAALYNHRRLLHSAPTNH